MQSTSLSTAQATQAGIIAGASHTACSSLFTMLCKSSITPLQKDRQLHCTIISIYGICYLAPQLQERFLFLLNYCLSVKNPPHCFNINIQMGSSSMLCFKTIHTCLSVYNKCMARQNYMDKAFSDAFYSYFPISDFLQQHTWFKQLAMCPHCNTIQHCDSRSLQLIIALLSYNHR